MSNHHNIIIIGAGQAAIACAAKLRSLSREISITLFGNEPHLPYQRPPLSKKYIMGEMTAENLQLRASSWYADNDIQVHKACPVASISRDTNTVRTQDGRKFPYDALVIATGSRPRTLSDGQGVELDGVLLLRSIEDADIMTSALNDAQKILVVGGGYIGLEAASVFSKLGRDVTLIEAGPRILQRVASSQTAAYFHGLHQKNNIKILEDTMLEKLEGDVNNRVRRARLIDGRILKVDLVLVGIGGIANDDIARAAGLTCNNGIEVDAGGRTGDPSIFACGDVARLKIGQDWMRLESVQNAIDQSEAVASSIVGEQVSYQPVPWFWSDQYDVKLQIAGLSNGHDQVITRQGKRPGSLSFWYFKDGDFIAVDAMNDPQAYMVGRKLLEGKFTVDADQINNPDLNLKALLS